MFESAFKYSTNEQEDFKLALRKGKEWTASENRVLIILQTVPYLCLKEQDIMAEGLVRNTVTNAIKYSRQICRNYGVEPENFDYAIVNFNAQKHLHLKGTARTEMENAFTARMRKLITILKPTHILISGDQAAEHMLPKIDNVPYKRGWVHTYEGIPTVTTLDLDRLLEDNGLHANLLGFWCRHLAYLLMGKHPHTLTGLAVEPKYLETLEEFNELSEKLNSLTEKDFVAVDTETANLSVNHNAIYTIQFALSSEPNIGYVVPVDHPLGPHDSKTRLEIKRGLRQFFRLPPEGRPTLVTFNGMFDLRVIRQALKLPVINLTVWEVMAGEHLLDENTTELKDIGPPMGGLAATLCSYGNDFYFNSDTKFSKADRATTGTIQPNDPDFLKYGATDVVCLLGIVNCQKARAAKTPHTEQAKSYLPYFEAHMRYMMSDEVHALSHLKEDGSYVDRQYLRSLMKEESPLRQEIANTERQLRQFKTAQKANDTLLKNMGLTSKGLFGNTVKSWIFKLSKTAHKSLLFLEILGLEPVDYTETGAPSIGKSFRAQYQGQHREVAIFDEWTKRVKLLSTYVVGWYKKLRADIDSAADGYLRPDYTFFDVVTGRLASRNPSLQQIPARGKLSKIIKRMFVAPPGRFMVRFDYSAHEVRMWSVVSGDMALAESFRQGQKLRQEWIQNPTPEIAAELKTKGDVHIQNCYRFWRKWVEKSDPLRDAVKRVIFGLLYGLSPVSMGKEVGIKALARKRIHAIDDEVFDLTDKKGNPTALLKAASELAKCEITEQKQALTVIDDHIKTIKAEKATLSKTLGDAESDEREDSEYAQSLIDKTFEAFPDGARWTERMKILAEKAYYVFSPVHRRRHLYASMTMDKNIVSRQVRRGSNAPIQGFSSELGSKAGRMIVSAYYKELPYFSSKFAPGKVWESKLQFSRQVHDASYFTVPYFMVIPLIHITQWQATYGLAREIEAKFGFKFTVEPEIEIEIGTVDVTMTKWDFSMDHLVKSITTSIDEGIELGYITESRGDVLQAIFAPYQDDESIAYLQQYYPLLNVSDLTNQIKAAVQNV
jgi:DNA polymerase I-like protein with 3'-5' exonuclease and polymerase domains